MSQKNWTIKARRWTIYQSRGQNMELEMPDPLLTNNVALLLGERRAREHTAERGESNQ